MADTPHPWNVSLSEARLIQEKLRREVRLQPLTSPIRTIAGVDISCNRFQKTVYAGIIVFSYPDLEVITYEVHQEEAEFPYIPGFLSFREIPSLLSCWNALTEKPDLVMVDGQGIAHPRRLGIASHLGVLIDTPTIGCAKSVLTGTYRMPKKVGTHSPLVDVKQHNEIIGAVLLSKQKSNPLIISPGHRITLKESVKVVQGCLRGYRLPEPTRLAHLLVNQFRRGELLRV